MKKFLSYILISLIIGANLLAPISVGWNKNNLEVKSNKAEADFITVIGPNNNGAVLKTTISKTNKSIKIEVTVIWTQGPALFTTQGVQVTKTDPSGVATPVELPLSWAVKQADGYHQTGSTTFPNLLPLTTYNIRSEARQINQVKLGTSGLQWNSADLWKASPNTPDTPESLFFNAIREDNVKTLDSGDTRTVTEDEQVTKNLDAALPNCELDDAKTWAGCFGIALYHLIFRPTSYIFAKTGQLLDFTVDYSTRDKSYRSAFVVEGWGVVRDFCNMFFIFVLLYIAFKTILGLGASKTKEMIINVVIIGLLINFSLFATQVIIDASNILTRVFYNTNTIQVGPKVNGVVQNETGPTGEIKLSEAIVAKINPQDLIFRAAEVNDIPIKGNINSGQQIGTTGVTAGTFIIVTILASVVNVVGLITFLMCSLIFISRVVGLWLAMIFAPLAFFSYTIPAMQEWEMIGWKKWWPETLKMAFLAPVFVFFMYLIIKFLETGLGIADTLGVDKSKMDFVIGIFVPFIFIMILLIKAKDITTKMSGKIGETITSAAKTVGGVALGVAGGAALGLGAVALRGTVGRLGNKLATSEWASTHGAVGRGLGNVGKWAGSGSMDVRGVKIGGKSLADTGVKFGKAKEGGYTKHLSDKVEKRQKRAKDLEVHESEPLKQALNKTEIDLQSLLNENKKELDSLDKTIEVRRQALADATAQYGAGKPETIAAGYDLQNAKRRKKALKGGDDYTGDLDLATGVATTTNAKSYAGVAAAGMYTYVDSNGATQTVRRTINNMEIYEVKNRKADIEDENRERKGNYAREKARFGGRANKEAEHKIIMDTKLDSGTKT